MTTRTARSRLAAAVRAAAVLAATAGTASATNYTWTATGGGLFSATGNWSPSTGAPSSTADGAFFNAASSYSVTLGASVTAGSLAVSAGSVTLLSSVLPQKAWTLNSASISGGTLTLGTSATNPVSVNPLLLNITGAGAVVCKSTSDIISTSVNVGTSGSAATSTLTIDGGGSTLTANGGLTVGAAGGHGSVVVQNNASAAVAGTGVMLGDATSSGELRLLNSATLTTPSISAGVGSADPGATAYLLIDGSSTLTINGNGTINAGSASGGATTISVAPGGTLNTGTGATLIDKTATLSADTTASVNIGGSLTVRGTATFNPGTLHLGTGKSVTASGGGSITLYDGFATPKDSTISVDGGTLTTQELVAGDGADFTLGQGSAVTVTNGGTFTPRRLEVGNGSTVAGGSVTVDGAGSSLTTVAGAGPSYVGANNGSGTLSVRHGASASFGDTLHVGSFGSTSSGTLTVDTGGTAVLKDLYLSTSSLSASTGTVNVSDLGSSLTIQNNLYAGGTSATAAITVASGASLVQGAGTLATPVAAKIGTGGGTTNLLAGTTLRIAGGDVALGTVNADAKTIQLDSGSLGFDGSLAVGPTGPLGGAISLGTGTALAMSGAVTIGPSATLSLVGGALATAAVTNNGGTFNYSYGTLAITGPGGLAVGVGTPLGNAPTLVAGQTLLVTAGTTVDAGATLNVYGATVTTGTLANSGLLTVGNFASATVSGGLTNASAGRLFVGADLTFTVNGASSNAGRITLQGASARLIGAGSLTNTGVITGDGEIGKDVTNALGGELRADAGQHLFFSGASATNNAGKITLLDGTVEFSAPLVNGAGGTVTGRGTILANGGLTNGGQVSFSGGFADVRGAVTNNSKILVTGGSTTTFYDAFVNSAGANVFTAAGSAVVFLGPVSGTGTYTGTGTKYFSDGSSSMGAMEPGGITVVEEPASLVVTDFIEQGVTANGQISVPATAQGGKTSKINVLSIGPTGSFDLADTGLIVDYAGASSADQLRQYLLGNQLTSSTAAADPQHRLAIGYVDNALLGASAWSGLVVDATSVLTKLTYFGDANLDGKVDADDFALVDKGYAGHLTGWAFGDFNYDNAVNAADYLLIDRVFGQQSGTLSPELLARRESQFGAAYVSELVASVPEPSGVGGVVVGVSLLVRRRRERARRPWELGNRRGCLGSGT